MIFVAKQITNIEFPAAKNMCGKFVQVEKRASKKTSPWT